jgi:hypothetical protein
MHKPSQPNAARPGRRTRRAPALAFALSVAGAASPAIAADAPAAIASDQVPAEILRTCEAKAQAFGAYDVAVAGAIADLDALGVFAPEDFSAVRIGLCPLRAHGGPVATTACARDIILLDEKYAGADARPLLRATLAHEMQHVRQHRDRRVRRGAAWCDSDAYRPERAALEAEAAAFGDAVAALFYVGRPIEVRNACTVAVGVFLEGEGVAAGRAGARLFDAAAGATVQAPSAATSRHVRYYARSAAADGRRWVWGDAQGPDRRFIDGRTVGLRRLTLPAPRDAAAPFRLVLRCPEL